MSGRLRALIACAVLVLNVVGAATVRAVAMEPRDQPRVSVDGNPLGTGDTENYTDSDGTEVFRVDDGWDLDQYLCRDASPLEFEILIDRSFGPVDAEGHPAPGNSLHGKVARLTLRNEDVDEDAGERDTLSVNGTLLAGFLSGAHAQHSVQTFEIPTSLLRLPAESQPLVANEFSIEIDTLDGGWCVEVGFAELRLGGGVAPALFLHGINSSGAAMQDVQTHFDLAQPGLITETPDFGPISNLEATEAILDPVVHDALEESGTGQVNLIAHSAGGLRARLYAFMHPDTVASVTMLGAPNGGSEFASSVCGARDLQDWGPLFWTINAATADFGPCDSQDDLLWQLQLSYVRDSFNEQVKDLQGIRYGTIAGTESGMSSLLIPFSGDNDGVVSADSVEWLSRDRADHPGEHFPISRVSADHSGLITEGSPAMEPALCFAYPTADGCAPQARSWTASQSGVMELGQTENLVLSDVLGSEIAPGTTEQVPVSFEGAVRGGIMVVADGEELTATLGGQALSAELILGVRGLGLTLTDPVDGVVSLTNTGTAPITAAVFVAVESERQLTILEPGIEHPGQPVTVTAQLSGAGANETIQGLVTDSTGSVVGQLTFAPSGSEWTAPFTPATGGTHRLTAWTDGSQLRTASVVVPVATERAAILAGFSETLVDADDGVADALEIAVSIDASHAGDYAVAAELRSASGQIVATTGTSVTLPAGVSVVPLQFAGREIYESGVSGPYEVAGVVVSSYSPVFAIADDAPSLGWTPAYDHDVFDHVAVMIDPAGFTDSTVDPNQDGLYDALIVAGTGTIDTAGTYAINARLVSPDGTEVAEFQTQQDLVSGVNPIEMKFSGASIAAAGLDGPYSVIDLSVYPADSPELLAFLIEAHTSATAYSAAAFGLALGDDTERVSVASDGAQGNSSTDGTSISADGRFVAFASRSTNLVPNDTNSRFDVFVHDRASGETRRVSVSSDGLEATADSSGPAISGDGNYVAFHSAANLVPDDTNNTEDVFG